MKNVIALVLALVTLNINLVLPLGTPEDPEPILFSVIQQNEKISKITP